MSALGFEHTSNLVDLLLSPHGSEPLYQNLVPKNHQDKNVQEKIFELENFLISHGLNQDTMGMLLEAGVRSLQLLALLPPTDLPTLFPAMQLQQRRLLVISIRRLDPRPSYQITTGLKRLLKNPIEKLYQTHEETTREKSDDDKTDRDNKVEAALTLLENSQKILECPVCYLMCLPPRIWQV